jgi:hypothetical protein
MIIISPTFSKIIILGYTLGLDDTAISFIGIFVFIESFFI